MEISTIKDIYKLDLAICNIQIKLYNTVVSKVSEDILTSDDLIRNLPQSSTSDISLSELAFVKWIRKSGVSIHNPDFRYDGKSDIISISDFDPSNKSCGNGIHIMSLDCALGYLFQEHLMSELRDLSLMICSIPGDSKMIRHSFRLYSKIRVETIKRHHIISFDFPQDCIRDAKIDDSMLNRSDEFMFNHFKDNDVRVWRLAYYLAGSKNAVDINDRKRAITEIINDTRKYVSMHRGRILYKRYMKQNDRKEVNFCDEYVTSKSDSKLFVTQMPKNDNKRDIDTKYFNIAECRRKLEIDIISDHDVTSDALSRLFGWSTWNSHTISKLSESQLRRWYEWENYVSLQPELCYS